MTDRMPRWFSLGVGAAARDPSPRKRVVSSVLTLFACQPAVFFGFVVDDAHSWAASRMVNGRTRTVKQERWSVMFLGRVQCQLRRVSCRTCDSDGGGIRVHRGLWMPAAVCKRQPTEQELLQRERVHKTINLSAVPVDNGILEKIESQKGPGRLLEWMKLESRLREGTANAWKKKSEGNDVAGSSLEQSKWSSSCNFSPGIGARNIDCFGRVRFP